MDSLMVALSLGELILRGLNLVLQLYLPQIAPIRA